MSQIDIVEVKQLRPMLQNFNEELGRWVNDKERIKLGRVLTLIDASFNDPEQRKAVKDLVQDMWWSDHNQPSNGTMSSPHTDIRGLTLALGFELYPKGEAGLLAAPPDSDYFESVAQGKYEQYADIANKAK